MRKVVLFGLFVFLSVSLNAQNSALVKENQPVKEFSDETKSLGEAEIIIFISVDDKEVELPAYIKNSISLNQGFDYADQLMGDLKKQGVKVKKYNMSWTGEGEEKLDFSKE